ncbi:hypothetical protein AAC387_Pa02g0637 [Persea americana]
MAERTNVDSHPHLSLSALPQISKEMQGPDGSIPLSPQWLLPKSGENKSGMEPHMSPHPNLTGRADAVKALGNGGDTNDPEKRKDIFRPSFPDVEGGRRDRWRDEERDTGSAIRRDRWREADKEIGDTRKMERWTDSSSMRHTSEARRVPSERWNESGNREGGYDQRRESKWNTRWGPDDKEPERESRREKWLDSGRDSEGLRDKGAPLLSNHGKEMDREGDHYSRSRRSNSSVSRGRAEPPHHQTLTPNKQVSMFSFGRGRGENATSTFSAGRGRSSSIGNTTNKNSSHSSLDALSDKADNIQGDSSILRYNRTKLLDVYRTIDMRTHVIPLDGLTEVASLTQMEPLEPLALFVPTPEEFVILQGIDKGDIVSSGAPQASKDGSVGRNSTDATQLRRTKLGGSKEDLSSGVDDYKDESNIKDFRTENAPLKKVNQEAGSREVDIQESSAHCSTLWRSESLVEQSQRSLQNWQDSSTDLRSRPSDLGWSHQQKDHAIEWDNRGPALSSSYKDESNWQSGHGFHSDINRDSFVKRQSSEFLDGEREPSLRLGRADSFISREKINDRKLLPHPSPEDLTLYYKDPQGEIQGPFSGSDMIGWFEAGYFGIDLEVRLATASPDTPFSSLGDVMPHLKMKARPPPGFGAPKQSDTSEASGRVKFSGLGKAHSDLTEVDLRRSEQRNRLESSTEAENRFLESLMSANMINSPPEAFPFLEGYAGNNSGNIPPVGFESGGELNYLLAQRISLARQRSLPNPLPYWPGRDAAPSGSQAEISPGSSIPHSNLLPSVVENSHQTPLSSQHVNLRSILQAAADKSSPTTWSNLSDRSLSKTNQGGVDILQDKMDTHNNQHFSPPAGYGIQQQRLQSQLPPSLPHMVTQPVDHNSGIVTPEKLLSSGISQDPQMLSILQQQYLLSQLQLHPQSPVPTQLSVLDKILLLKQQQQKQEQQQQHQQLLLQQQHHLLSQVLSENPIQQHFMESSYGHLQTAIPAGNTSLDQLGLRQPLEVFQMNSQMPHAIPLSRDSDVNEPAPSLQDGQRSNFVNSASQISQDVSQTVGSSSSAIGLPNQVIENSAHQESWAAILPQQFENIQDKHNLPIPVVTDYSLSSEVVEKSSDELVLGKSVLVPDKYEDEVQDHEAQNTAKIAETVPVGSFETTFETTNFVPTLHSASSAGTGMNNTFLPVKDGDLKVSSGGGIEKLDVQREVHGGLPEVVEVKNVDTKKSSERKSRRQKNSKVQSSSDQVKGASKTVLLQQSKVNVEAEWRNIDDAHTEMNVGAEIPYGTHYADTSYIKSGTSVAEATCPQPVLNLISTSVSENIYETQEGTDDSREVGSRSLQSTHAASGHRAWKPAPGLKAKSLLEIQEEEQRRAQTEMAVPEVPAVDNPTNSSSTTPWAGVIASSEPKTTKNIHKDTGNTQFVLGNSEDTTNLRSEKSQLHDLLAEEVLAKANERASDVPASTDKGSTMSPLPVTTTQLDVSIMDDDDFVEAKETKKSRKKAAKAKGAGVKASPPVASVDLLAAAVPIEKSKSSRQMQQEKEVLPIPSSGPSLGDFVLWKEEQPSAVPAPAWSTDSGKLLKPTSLRDIQKEQQKKATSTHQQTPVVTPPKAQSNRAPSTAPRGSGSSWLLSGTSPSKVTASLLHMSSHASTQSKSKVEDDLFWGPLDQSKQESKQSDFPSLANPNSRGSKGTPAKGVVGGSFSRQKSLSSSPASYKGRRDAMTKHTEAMDFRDWCESESVRLTGTRDTSFLEFCLKQSTSEAEMLLTENLGSFDPDREFIDKFLNYKELLSSDVIEIAFQSQNERKITGFAINDASTDSMGARDVDPDASVGLDGSTKGGAKKKGKKGKKVSPSVLGFSVVSNRIMMGEIQNAED